jgi:hypothetical protein
MHSYIKLGAVSAPHRDSALGLTFRHAARGLERGSEPTNQSLARSRLWFSLSLIKLKSIARTLGLCLCVVLVSGPVVRALGSKIRSRASIGRKARRARR